MSEAPSAEVTLPVPARALTWDDLQAVPDELHHHYELIEGQLLMSPSPSALHQSVVLNLAIALKAKAPADQKVYVAPFDFVPEPHIALQPDVLVVRRGAEQQQRIVEAPVLVVEVLSPSSRTSDRTTKRALYARHGVAHYWLVDPDDPSILALALAPDGEYEQVAAAHVDDVFTAAEPFAVELTPAALVRD